MIYIKNTTSGQTIYIPMNTAEVREIAPRLQTKSIDIDENGEYQVSYDSDYDGLDKVLINVAVPQGQGYQEGYEDGYREGYSEGYAEGFDDGKQESQEEAFNSGYTSGYSEGFESGYTEGVQASQEEAYNSGYTKGYEDGYNSGYTEGYNSGLTIGYQSGLTIGYQSGYTEGLTIGYNSGLTIGYNSGLTIGYNSGYTEGYEDGQEEAYNRGYEAGIAYQKSLLVSTSFTENDTYTRENGYNSVIVNVECPTPSTSAYVKFSTTGTNTVSLHNAISLTLQYSYDNQTWATWNGSGLSFGGNNGSVYVRGINTDFNSKRFEFSTNSLVNVDGNAMALIDYTNTDKPLPNYAFTSLFSGCTSLLSVSNDFLPATILTKQCYKYMFNGCSSLTNAPKLPASVLAEECYYSMFEGCSSLVQAPTLPATTLAKNCYGNMFANCTQMVNAPALPSTSLAESCYYNMFYGCTSLTNAPILSASTLVKGCYERMFIGCSHISVITSYATNISASDSLYLWLSNVSTSGKLKVPSSMINQYPSGDSGKPTNWTYEAI